MLNAKIIFFFIILQVAIGITSAGATSFSEYCMANGGQIKTDWICPNSGKHRTGTFCEVPDSQGRPMVFNGCNVAIADYGVLFRDACVHHDLCYHHEPTTNGLSKHDCDTRFLTDMESICLQDRPNDSDCVSNAKLMYRAVDIFGNSSWTCSKEVADYPHNIH